MNAVVQNIEGELLLDGAEFFAPMAADLVDGLVGQYEAMRTRITALAAAVREEQYAGALHYFVEGNTREQRFSMPTTVAELFKLEGAVAKLNSELVKAMAVPEVIEKWRTMDLAPLPTTPEELAGYMKSESSRWGEVIKASGFKIEE